MEPISQIGLLCRACVSPLREEKYNLIETPMLFDLYIRFSSTNISPNDSLPKSICSKCHRLLYDFQDFQRTCVESHKILFDRIGIGALKLENDEEFAIKNESSSEISQTTYSIEYMDEFIDIKLETNDSDPLMDQQDPGSLGGLMKYTGALPDEATFSIEHMDQGSDLKLENNDSDQWRERKDEEPFGSPKEYCDPLSDLDFKDEALIELPEEIVAEIPSSKSLEVGNSIRRTYSNRLRKKSDVEDGTQMIGQKNESSEKPQPNLFVCEKCSKKFGTKVHYEGHLRWHEGKKHYACQQCSAEYYILSLLELHVLDNHNGDDVKKLSSTVEGCEKNCLNQQSLKLHMDKHSSFQPMRNKNKLTAICDSSGKTLSKETLREQEECIDEINDLKENNNDSYPLEDQTDQESFDSPKKYIDPLADDGLKVEVLTEQQEEIIAESTSSKSLEEESSIRRTYSKRLREKTDVLENSTQMIGEKNESSEESRINPFVCGKCSKKFRTKVHYEGHLRWHEGKKPYTCKQCYAEYTTLYVLNQHVLRNHTVNEVRFHGRIEDCEKNYLNKESLELHMNTQSSSQIYELLCKTLSNKSLKKQKMMYKDHRSLKYHKPMRKGEELIYELLCKTLPKKTLKEQKMMQNRHACDHCPKKFCFDYQLKRHKCKFIRSIKKYRCSLCGMTKTTMTQLQAHMNIHTPEKKYSCKFCKSRFVLRGSLLQHAREVHDDIQVFLCTFCDHLFELETFKHHMMQHMAEKPV